MMQLDPTWNAAVVGETLDGRTVYEAAIYGRFVMREWPSGMQGREQYHGVLKSEDCPVPAPPPQVNPEPEAPKAAKSPPKRAPKSKEKKP